MGDLHPMIVHFPIALLVLYALIEIASLHPKLKNNKTVFYIKLVLLLVGSFGAIMGAISGEAAQTGFAKSNLIKTHADYAELARNIFVILSILYGAKLYVYESKTAFAVALPPFLQSFLRGLSRTASKFFLPQIFAIVGLFTITIAGALGGAISHGKTVDPFVTRAVKTFVK